MRRTYVSSDETERQFREIQEFTGASVSEIIRRSVNYYRGSVFGKKYGSLIARKTRKANSK
jgi:hypothetical protein